MNDITAIKPPKLKEGDHIRVVGPSFSGNVFEKEIINEARSYLESRGFKISFSKHLFPANGAHVASVDARLEDLHEAFSDTSVAGILTVTGGYLANELLHLIDYALIAANPKVFCGYSDITGIGCAIYRKSNLMTFSGPHFSVFGIDFGELRNSLYQMFASCVMDDFSFEVPTTSIIVDHLWKDRSLVEGKFMGEAVAGSATGKLIGGNLCTLNLLQGTDYMPDLSNSLLFIEDTSDLFFTFRRDLQSLLQVATARGIRGVVVGRFQSRLKFDDEELRQYLSSKPELQNIPVIYNCPFGHTYPMITLPIGGVARMSTYANSPKLIIEAGRVS